MIRLKLLRPGVLDIERRIFGNRSNQGGIESPQQRQVKFRRRTTRRTNRFNRDAQAGSRDQTHGFVRNDHFSIEMCVQRDHDVII